MHGPTRLRIHLNNLKTFARVVVLSVAIPFGLAPFQIASASTSPLAPDLSSEPEQDVPATAEEIERSKQIEVTTPPPARLKLESSEHFFYHYRQALSIHGGIGTSLSDLASVSSTIGFQYRFFYPERSRAEVGADLLTSGTGLLHASRFHFLDDGRFRFFYKYGLEVRVVPSEELVTILKLANWRARLAGGLEWNTWGSIGLRMDLEAHIGTSDRTLNALAGLAYSF